jgi:cytochrome oxidase Cu insertion factor (SCO1/SenC/PrrC family)
MLAVTFGALGIVAALLVVRRAPRPLGPSVPPPAVRPRVLATLPAFVLEDERGESFGLDDLAGTVWIADFVFTRCAGPCPLITQAMARLADELAATPALAPVKLVSFTVDPDHDTPEILRAYRKSQGAERANWTFLTGARAVVRKLVREGFKLPIEDQDERAMPILHSQSFLVIDRAGGVRGAYDALTETGRKDLRAATQRLLSEPAQELLVPVDVDHPTFLETRKAEQQTGVASIAAPHDFQFADRLGASGIDFRMIGNIEGGKKFHSVHYDHGTALAAADVDGDGLPDLFFVNQAGKNGLYRNLGGGRFEDITARAGVAVGDRACVGASFADIDNDGDADLFVTAIRDGNLLFENDGHGRFTDITERAGVRGNGGHSSGAVFFDYDGDGLLDLFVTNVGQYTWRERRPDGSYLGLDDAVAGHLHPDRFERSLLYRNLGGGRFEETSASSGLTHAAWSGDATAFDYDEDGRPDLYVLSMQGHDELWRNLGGGRFERDGRKTFPATPWGSMGVKVLDWNGDGHLDLFVTDMHTDMAGLLAPEQEKMKHNPEQMFPPRFLATDGNHVLGNALFTRQGDRFQELSDAANVETGWPWGVSVGDLNADGWPDLFITAGMGYPYRYGGNSLLVNDRGRRFADAELVVGAEPRARLSRPLFELRCSAGDAQHDLCRGEAGPVLPMAKGAVNPVQRHGHFTVWGARSSRSSVLFDLDGDGDLDIVTNDYNDAPQVLVSDLAQRRPIHYLSVRLVGKRSNRDGIGALVTVKAKGHSQVQVNDGKSGYLAQSVLPLYFGLGEAGHADLLTVRWPSGKLQTLKGPLASSGTPILVQEP